MATIWTCENPNSNKLYVDIYIKNLHIGNDKVLKGSNTLRSHAVVHAINAASHVRRKRFTGS